MVATALLCSTPISMRTRAFQPPQPKLRTPFTMTRSSFTRQRNSFVVAQAGKEPADLLVKIVSTAAAFSVALVPIAAPSFAALDTNTQEKGVGAKIEGSDIQTEDQTAVLAKLKEKILPEAKALLSKVGKNEGGGYPSTAAKELETVQTEVEGLIRQANEGGDVSNIKSSASGIEQQINALKAIVGFD